MRIMSVVLAPFVSLVLILMPTVIVVHRDKPHGLPLQIAYQGKGENCETGRLVVARALANGNVSLNSEVEMRRSELADRLNQIFRTRAERVVFIEADPDLPVSSVADVIDISRREVDLVAILTPAVESGYCLSMHPPRAFF
jgi:biopolymer transport protein TolR